MIPNRIGVTLCCNDNVFFCGAYLNAGNAWQREINCVVSLTASCENGVTSGNQIFNALICSCVGEGFCHIPQRVQFVH
jgi:hypothetical protein